MVAVAATDDRRPNECRPACADARDVLTTLMRDTRWESRAYAVLGLAGRPDSIEVARVAAASDPRPQVRAWALYALSLHPAPDAPASAPPPVDRA